MIIETKYNLKDVVYSAYTTQEPYYEACPDCDGSGFWKIEGKDKTVRCETCNPHYSYNGTVGKVTKYKYFPKIESLTVGQVRTEVDRKSKKVVYMCKETGIGSGTLWSEEYLFSTAEEARALSEILCETSNRDGKLMTLGNYLQGGNND